MASRTSQELQDTTAPSKKESLDSGSTTANNDPLVTTFGDENGHLTGYPLVMIMFSATVIGFLLLLDISVVTTAIPKITSDFHSLDDVGWYGATYVLANCALQPLTGKIYSEFNMKWTFLAFFGLFELGSVLCGAAQSSAMLIIGRAVAGMGGSGILNGAYGIIHSVAPLEKQPFLVGLLIGISQIGILAGPLIGGALTEYASWRWCFYINLPSGGLAALLFIFVRIPDTRKNKERSLVDRIRKLDLIGFVFFAPAALQFILALQWGGIKYPWHSATIIGLLCGSFGTIIVFGFWEHHMGSGAMIPLALIRRRVIWSSCVNSACFMGSMLTATYYLPIYFQSVKDASPLMSGVDLLPSILSTVVAGIVTGGAIGRIGYYLPFGVASGALVALGSGLTSTFTPTTSVGVWVGYQLIMGFGRGMGFQIPIIAVQNNSGKEEVSIVNALVVFSQNLGGAIFLSLDQVIFSNGLRHNLDIYAPGVDENVVVAAGAVGIRTVVPPASLPGVILAYSKTFDRVMYLATGVAGGAMLAAFGMRWMSVKKKAEAEKAEKAAKAEKAENAEKAVPAAIDEAPV